MESFDPFAVFGLARRYDLDGAEVERIYLDRSVELHPDMVGEAGLGELGGDGGEVGARFAELSMARQVLEDPEKRAVALWRLSGGVEDKSLPPGFLLEMMEIREEIEAARGAEDPGAIEKWEGWTNQRRQEYERRVFELFARLTRGAPGNAEVLSAIKLELNAWRYIERLVEQLH